MINTGKSLFEKVFVEKTSLDSEQITDIVYWLNIYIETIHPDYMMIVDLSQKNRSIYEKCYNLFDSCASNCSVETIAKYIEEGQLENMRLVDAELRSFALFNVIPLRSCSFNLRFNLNYPNKNPITYLRKITVLSNDSKNQPEFALVVLQDVTLLTNAVQGIYFEIKGMQESLSQSCTFKNLENLINAKLNSCITLTKRENQVLLLLINGYTSLDISKDLFIAKTTVDKHRQNLMRKYKVSNVTQLIRKYLRSVV